jgi:hypothetical protein
MNSREEGDSHAGGHDYSCDSADTSHQAAIWKYYTEKG